MAASAASVDKKKAARVAGPYERIFTKMADRQKMEDISDFTIICGDRTWKVHRIFLAAYSDVLSTAWKGAFKESQTSTIEMKEDEPEIINAMVEFMYTTEYHAIEVDNSVLEFHAKMLVIADKYDIKELAMKAHKNFKAFTCSDVQCDAAIERALPVIFDAPQATVKIYELVVHYGSLHTYLYTTSNYPTFRSYMLMHSQFALDIATAVSQPNKDVFLKLLQRCGEHKDLLCTRCSPLLHPEGTQGTPTAYVCSGCFQNKSSSALW